MPCGGKVESREPDLKLYLNSHDVIVQLKQNKKCLSSVGRMERVW